MLEPLDSQRLAGFVSELDPVNATADGAPGFVWRLKTEEGNATSLTAFEWDISGSAGPSSTAFDLSKKYLPEQ